MILGILPLFVVNNLGASRAMLGIIETIQRTVIPKYISPDRRGTAYGLYYLIIGLSFFVCNIIFGFLWDSFSFEIAIVYSLSLSTAAVIGMLLSFEDMYIYDFIKLNIKNEDFLSNEGY